MLGAVYEWFWWDRLWLPENLTWADLEDREGRVYAKASHLYAAAPFTVGFLLVRFMFERWIATPLALKAGVKRRSRVQTENIPVLEHYYGKQSRQPSQADVTGLCKKTGLSVREVERWFRRRRRLDQPGVLRKFTEAFWRFFFYVFAFCGGILALYDKEWFYDTKEIWRGFPKQSMLDSQYWYYILEMSFYGSLLLRVAFDIKRKDFREQIVHHCATLVLLSFSWCANYIRVGTLVMLVHDASDVLLESAKMFNYAKWERTCQGLFVLFAVVFMWTRLVIFPFWLIHCAWVYPPLVFPPFFGYYFFNAMLLVLQALHVFWAYLILRMVQKMLFGQLLKDERSDDAEETEDAEDAEDAEEEEEESHYRGVVKAKGQNGCSELLPPLDTHCPSKTVY
ncbi:ceramide synthase 2 [Eucyclogobius newberryi]|uniref:ceramide synthase 2 n=1 Tax=Eucyclogobius newberryi TaxID=166745 RepID=UPI003B5A8293